MGDVGGLRNCAPARLLTPALPLATGHQQRRPCARRGTRKEFYLNLFPTLQQQNNLIKRSTVCTAGREPHAPGDALLCHARQRRTPRHARAMTGRKRHTRVAPTRGIPRCVRPQCRFVKNSNSGELFRQWRCFSCACLRPPDHHAGPPAENVGARGMKRPRGTCGVGDSPAGGQFGPISVLLLATFEIPMKW